MLYIDPLDSRRCVTCKHCAYDPDDLYCGHKASFAAASPFGQGLNLARSAEGVCGPEGRLYEKCTCTNKYCPRHSK